MQVIYEFDYSIEKTTFDEDDYKKFKKEINKNIKDKKKRKKYMHRMDSKNIELVLIMISK